MRLQRSGTEMRKERSGSRTTTLTHLSAIAQPAGVNSTLNSYSGYAYAVMRIVVGLLFACHGGQKVFGMFGGKVAAGFMMVVGIIELVGGFMIALGFLTRWTAFLCSGLMAAAYFKAHAGAAFFPIVNRGESAVFYCFVFLYMFFRGSGPLSIDSLLFRGGGTPADEVGGPMRTGRTI